MKESNHKVVQGMTLIELLMVLAIIVLLMGITFAAMGPVREKGRQAVCISHLRQIGQALAIYRQQWGGTEADGPKEYYQLGLPPGIISTVLDRTSPSGYRIVYLIGTKELWQCPSVNREIIHPKVLPLFHYFYTVWDDRAVQDSRGTLPRFQDAIAQRGEELAIVTDENHSLISPPRLALLLRLNGQVQAKPMTPDLYRRGVDW